MAPHSAYAAGEVIANKYVVEGPLGEGPNGTTYLANSGMGSQKLCVKIYRPEISSQLLAAPDFFLKAGVATEIEHDNLAACLDVQEEMGRVFAARVHVEGHDFEEWIRRNRREGNYFTRGLELLWQSCQGLSALHERTRHLNIHPGNVLVSPLMAKLADWDPRSLGSMEMTPEPLPFRPAYAGYRAPEMATRGSFLSYPSTDLYAVAGILYRLVLGEHPESDLGRLQAGIRSLEKDLGAFLAKAMHPRPEERYQDASAFSDALWEMQGAMQRLQDRQPRNAGRSSTSFPAPRGQEAVVQPESGLPPARREPSFQLPPAPMEATPPTLAMDAKEATLFGSAPSGQQAANPAKSKEDSFFDFFPTAEQASQPTPPPARKAASSQAQPAPSSNETFFGSSLESPPRGGTLFGDPPPARSAPEGPSGFGNGAHSPSTGLGGLEEPGTLFGSVPGRRHADFDAPPSPARKPSAKPEAKPAVVSLTSLEKDPLDSDAGESGGFTQFGFKGAGDNATLHGENGKADRQRKLMIALAAVGILVLALALGGLFVYMRTTAAPEVPVSDASPPPDDALGAGSEPVAAAAGIPDPGAAASPPSDGPPFPETQGDPEPVAARPDPAPPAQPVAPPPPDPTPPAAGSAKAPKGSPERLAQLMKMVETRGWPDSPGERLKAADELNDFGKVAEANVVYGRAVLAAGVTEKQKISALGGLAVTFYSMGMKDQSRDAINQILEMSPQNAFALKFKEKLK